MTEKTHGAGARGRFDQIDEADCWTLVQTATVGRVAFKGPEGVELLPVNFVPHEHAVYLRIDPTSVLGALAQPCDDVTFEVDHHDDVFGHGWSVVLYCSSDVVETHEAERALAGTTRLGPWASGDRPTVVRLAPDRITGRRVTRS